MTHKVVAVAYDRLCTFEFGCAVELFALPRPELPVPWYEFAVCAAERGPMRVPAVISVSETSRSSRSRLRRSPKFPLAMGGNQSPGNYSAAVQRPNAK